MSRLVALLACHNRKEQTLACLRSVFDQDETVEDIEAIVVDDGSDDGTAGAVRALFPSVDVIRGDGTLFWARSMALAEEQAMARAPDYLLWLNDDVVLDRGALRTLFAAEAESGGDRIVVGSVVDPETGTPTYGGVDRVDWHPMRYRLVAPHDGVPQPCTTFNGNVVLVPRSVYRNVGGIERRFVHACADLDYGLRARALGFQVVVAGKPVGTCARGPGAPWDEPSLSLASRYRLMLGRRGIPVGSFAFYLRRHGGRAWPLYLLATYAKVTSKHVRSRVLAARAHGG